MSMRQPYATRWIPTEHDEAVNAPDPDALSRWVVQTFDYAVEQACHGHGSLQLLHAAASLRAETLSEAAVRRLARSGQRLGRARLQRLLQLAPAAIDWVERHPVPIDLRACADFRRHLQHRCDAVLHGDGAPCDEE